MDNEDVPSSPFSKRHCAERLFSNDQEISDVPDEIFPSEDEDYQNEQQTETENYEAFYPSEESNLPPIMDFDLLNNPVSESSTKVMNPGESDAELVKISRLLIGTCCEKLCLRHLTAMDIISNKVDYLSMTRSNQRIYLLTNLKENSCQTDIRSGSITTKFYVAGKEICSSTWAQVYDISMRTLSRMLQQIVSQKELTHGNLGKKRHNTKAESVTMWMDVYLNLIRDKMPDKDQIHLPSWETHKDIYSRYLEDMQKRGVSEEEIAGISVFYKMWNEEFSNVVIPQVCTHI